METELAIRQGSLQVTVLCLVAAGLLVLLGLAGTSSSILLVAVFALLSAGLYLTRPDDGTVGTVLDVDVDSLLASLWLAPALAAAPLLLELGATPQEVQALGGLVGLAGMLNYFLRPLYLVGYSLVRMVLDRRQTAAGP